MECGEFGDELTIAAATASSLGIHHEVVRDMPPMQDVIRRQSLLFQSPVLGPINVGWLLQIRRRAAAAGATCVLTGESGNLTINAGGLYNLADLVRQQRWLTWFRQARLAAYGRTPTGAACSTAHSSHGFPESLTRLLRRRYIGPAPSENVSFLRPDWRARAIEAAQALPRFASSYDVRIHMIRNGNAGLFRKGAIAGEQVDERDPLADQRLVEFSLRIPPEHLYWNGRPRPLAQAALQDRLPQSVIDLKTRGLQSADWAQRFTQGDAQAFLDQISTSATARELLDLNRVKKAISRWPTHDWNSIAARSEIRLALISALSAGVFALVHEEIGPTAPLGC